MSSTAAKNQQTSLIELTVASYNIHRCIGGDGRHDPARIARIIREINPDILALQEVESRFGKAADIHQLNYLADATGLSGIPGPTILRPDSHYGNALLTRHRIVAVRRLDLSILSDREPRGALDVDIEVEGRSIRVIATHLGLQAGERREQVKRLLIALSSQNRDSVILLGDINEWACLSQTLRRLKAHFGHFPAPRTFPSSYPLFALDRLWIYPSTALIDIQAYNTPLTRIASDHLPLIARIRKVVNRSAASLSPGGTQPNPQNRWHR